MITLSKEECVALHEIIDMATGGNAESVFAWDGSDDEGNLHAVAKVYRAAGKPIPDLFEGRLVSPLKVAADVGAFHRAGEVPMPTTPAFPPEDRIELRKKLIREEAGELLLAIEERDLVEVADGCADLVVVTIGTMLEFGMNPTSIWNEVQRTNMAKFPTCTHCGGTTYEPMTVGNTKCSECAGRGTQLLQRPDGKILKPEGWTPPDIRAVLIEQGAPLDADGETL